jgi:hypothetical protein
VPFVTILHRVGLRLTFSVIGPPPVDTLVEFGHQAVDIRGRRFQDLVLPVSEPQELLRPEKVSPVLESLRTHPSLVLGLRYLGSSYGQMGMRRGENYGKLAPVFMPSFDQRVSRIAQV